MPNPVFQDGLLKQEDAQKHGSGGLLKLEPQLVEGEKGKALLRGP